MDKILERLITEFHSEEARYAYADSVTNAFLTAQIKALREDHGMTQEKLAELVGTKQSGISRWQNGGYSSCKVESLRKFAKAFGVRLRIRFEEFGTLPDEVKGFDERNLAPRKFEDDPAFKEACESEAEEIAAPDNPQVADPVTAFDPGFSNVLSAIAKPQADLAKQLTFDWSPFLASIESQRDVLSRLAVEISKSMEPLLAGIEAQQKVFRETVAGITASTLAGIALPRIAIDTSALKPSLTTPAVATTKIAAGPSISGATARVVSIDTWRFRISVSGPKQSRTNRSRAKMAG